MVGWGLADYLAAQGSKIHGTLKTFAWIQISGLVTLLIMVPWLDENAYWASEQKLLGFAAVFLFTGMYLLLYRGFEKGLVSVISPVFSAYVLVTILVGYLLFDERLSAFQGFAVGLLVVGIFLSSADWRETARAISSRLTRGIVETIGAMVLAGGFFAILAMLARQVGWFAPFLAIRVGSVVLILLVIWFSRGKLRIDTVNLVWVLLAGVFDSLAFLVYNQALRLAPIAIVGPIGGSFSIITIILALVFLKERPALNQWLGITAIVGGIIMLGTG
jgi:uncharacterized membrane protein